MEQARLPQRVKDRTKAKFIAATYILDLCFLEFAGVVC